MSGASCGAAGALVLTMPSGIMEHTAGRRRIVAANWWKNGNAAGMNITPGGMDTSGVGTETAIGIGIGTMTGTTTMITMITTEG